MNFYPTTAPSTARKRGSGEDGLRVHAPVAGHTYRGRVRRRSSAATSSSGGRSGRCSRSDSVPGNPGARAPPPRNRQRARSQSPPCPATALRPRRRRWCLRRRGVVPRSCRKSPTGSLRLGRFPAGCGVVGSWIWKKNSSRSRKVVWLGIERDLDRFRVRAMVAVRGVLDVAARVADPRRDDAG